MSKQYPIIAITGSSGAGTSTVRVAMEHIFRRDGINAVTVEGDSFHR
ncbi:MAG TPA: phosphoribulokinase, partial [Gammaproteobacteria bacterium]|nr:phosphoribulokinase [Gammaproteobacteria bacterium]